MTLAPAVGRFYARRRVAEGAVVAHLRWHGAPLLTLALMVGAFYAPFLLSGTAQWDAIEVHYSGQRYFGEAIRAGRLPFWTPYLFSGFPFLADLQVGAWYPLNWPFMLLGVTPDTMNAELLLHGLIACAGAYALAYRLTGNRPGATASTWAWSRPRRGCPGWCCSWTRLRPASRPGDWRWRLWSARRWRCPAISKPPCTQGSLQPCGQRSTHCGR